MATKQAPVRRKRRHMSTSAEAWLAFAIGMAGSIAFNIASNVGRNGLTPSVALEIFWPLVTWRAVELMIRADWRPGRAWKCARYGMSGVVALVGFVISFGHIYDVMIAMGEGPFAAMVAPLGIDVLMLLSSAALVGLRMPKPRTPRKPAARRTPALRAA